MILRPIDGGIAKRIGTYSDAVEIAPGARVLHVSGTPGIDAEGRLPSEFAEQAELAWGNLLRILAAAEMGVENLVLLTHYLIRRADLAAYRDIRGRYLGAARPASMLLFVDGLVWPEMLIEIAAVAAE